MGKYFLKSVGTLRLLVGVPELLVHPPNDHYMIHSCHKGARMSTQVARYARHRSS